MIGMFDSGVGGLAVLRHLHRIAPGLPTTYVADRRHLPYGEKPESFIAERAVSISRRLIEDGASVVAMACNTASAAALEQLRATFPGTRFVGMEPAVKPAAAVSQTGVIGVLATRGTLAGRLMRRVEEAYGADVVVHRLVGHGLASAVEFGTENGSTTTEMVRRHVLALSEAGGDTLVLGCTHYSFLTERIRAIAGEGIAIIDPSEAVARQIVRMSESAGIASTADPAHRYLTTADRTRVRQRVKVLTGVDAPVDLVDW